MPFDFSSWLLLFEVTEELGRDTVHFIPRSPKIGMDILKGSSMATAALIKQSKKPNGAHINMTKKASGVGRKTNLPSWKINGFGYFSIGRTWQFFFSASLTKQITCMVQHKLLKRLLKTYFNINPKELAWAVSHNLSLVP
jgi:hypothetical protein